MTAALDRLRELTEKLPSLVDVVSLKTEGRIEYDVIQGFTVGFSLDHTPDAALQKVFLAEGTRFPTHSHEGWEHMFIVKGSGTFRRGDVSEDVEMGSWTSFAPNEPHDFIAKTAVIMYAITQPPCEGYPGDGK